MLEYVQVQALILAKVHIQTDLAWLRILNNIIPQRICVKAIV